MKLEQLLQDITYTCLKGSTDTEISGIAYDSRKVEKGFLFVCIRGAVTDGHNYAAKAVEAGAAALLVEYPVDVDESIVQIRVEDARRSLAFVSAVWFDYPSRKLTTIGLTGTKGKTTTTYMIHSILTEAGHKAGLIGTIECLTGNRQIPAEHTTPESYLVQKYMAEMVEAGCDCMVMEVSSQALMLDRVAGITFDYGVFTNIEPDHIGPAEHKSFEEYLGWKNRLLQQCRVGIVNRDDVHFEQMVKDHTCELETYGFSPEADLRAVNETLVSRPGYLGISYHTEGLMSFLVEVHVPGKFSIYNSLAAIAICRRFGVEEAVIADALKKAKTKGRVEMVKVSDEFTLLIDYAHNAMALESLLGSLREYKPHRLVCLFGCGGNRDRNRRFEMGEISGKMADFTIITSDNPRYEDPQAIIDDIRTGISRTDGSFVEIIDRKEAIAYAIRHGEPGDIIILAGKGHEDYQIIQDKKYPMDERVLIQEILEHR